MARRGSRGALAALGLMAALVGATPARAQDASVQPIAVSHEVDDVTPAPDGAVWGDQPVPQSNARSLVHFDANGARAAAAMPPDAAPLSANGLFHVLPDGTVGMFARTAGGKATALLRLSSSGSDIITRQTTLPPQAATASGLAVAPDGAVWFARACQDRIYRLDRGLRLTSVRLSRIGCGTHAAVRERGASLALGVDGSVWLVDLCQGRIAQVALGGRVREWWPPRISCPDDNIEDPTHPAHIAVDPRGGIAWDNFSIGAGSGRIAHGRRERFPDYGAGVFATDGTLWRWVAGGLERRTPGGRTETLPIPAGLDARFGLTQARDGSMAFVSGTFVRSYDPGAKYSSPYSLFGDQRLVSIGADGRATSVSLPPLAPDPNAKLTGADVVLAADGALWVDETGQSDPIPPGPFPVAFGLVRVVPADVAPPQRTVARPRGVLARTGGVVWLKVLCDAEPGRWCIGTAAIAPWSGPFAIPGRTSGAVPIRLPSTVPGRLHRHHPVSLKVVLGTRDGGVDARTIRLSG